MTRRSRFNAAMFVVSVTMLTVTGCHSTPEVVGHSMPAQPYVASGGYVPAAGFVSSGYSATGPVSAYGRYQNVGSAMAFQQPMHAQPSYSQFASQPMSPQPAPSFVTTSPYGGYGSGSYGTQRLSSSQPSVYSGPSWTTRPPIQQVHCSPGGT